MRPSRGFVCTLAGIAVTIVSWFGPWEWPAWPALTVLRLAFGGNDAWQEMPFAGRAAVMALLIVVNVGFWSAAAWLATSVAARRGGGAAKP